MPEGGAGHTDRNFQFEIYFSINILYYHFFARNTSNSAESGERKYLENMGYNPKMFLSFWLCLAIAQKIL